MPHSRSISRHSHGRQPGRSSTPPRRRRHYSGSRSDSHSPTPPLPLSDSGSSTSRSSKRPRESSSEDEDDNGDDIEAKRLKCDPDFLVIKGRIFGRYGEMWRTMRSIIEEGIARDPEDADEDFTNIQNANYRAFKRLMTVIPTLSDDLRNFGARVVIEKLDLGRRRARSEDINGAKENISDWHTWNPPFPKSDRSLSGFKHPECGRLLCPADQDWDNEETRLKLKNNEIAVCPEDLPNFLWENCQHDASEPFEGFLRHSLLVKTYLHIFRGPAYAKNAHKSSRRGNALRHGINKVSIESIAYCACILRHTLSAQSQFTSGMASNGDFHAKQFYNTLLTIAAEMDEVDMTELLKWWNDQVFAGLSEDDDGIARAAADGNRLPSVAAQMRARARAKRQAVNVRAPVVAANV